MTLTCTSCGSANETGDTFCGSCSAFLEWDGAPAPATTAVPVAARVDAGAPGPGRSAPPPAAGPTPDLGSAVPGVPEQPGPPDLAPRVPQAEAPRPGPRRAVRDGPADHFCGACGAGNALGRWYCRACGAALADDSAPAPRSWVDRWVRPWWPIGRRSRARAAGERPSSWSRHAMNQQRRRRRGLRMPTRLSLGKIAIPLMILSLFGLGLTPLRATATTWVFETYDSLRLRFSPDLLAVTPAGATSDSQTEGHPALSGVDANLSSYWSEGREGPGIGATLTVDLAAPTDLVALGVHNGATDTEFARQPRVRTLQVDTVDVSGAPTSARLELEDTADFRSYDLSASAVTRVTLTIVDVYPGQEGQDTSLTEVSFHTRK